MDEKQLDLFDLDAGLKLKQKGMERAAESRAYVLSYAKRVAVGIAIGHSSRTCDIDQVQMVLKKEGFDLGMAAGSVFKGKDWEWTGSFKKTARKSSHARPVSIWRLKK